MSLEPIYSELVLIDKQLKDFLDEPDQKIIEEYKKTVQDKNRPITKHSRKKN
ncbi:11893_t:CDS:1, partial [Dentiscutata erythropus]